MTHRRRDCPKRAFFSPRTGFPIEDSKLGCQTWALAIYLLTISLKGVSSLPLSRDLGVCQRTARHSAMRLRQVFAGAHGTFTNDTEADATYFGRKSRGMKSRGDVAKDIIAGVLDRDTGSVTAAVIPNIREGTLHQLVQERVDPDVTFYTDELASCNDARARHETVNHKAREYVRDQAWHRIILVDDDAGL